MSKNIKDYIEGIAADENVPSISGIIRKIVPPDEKPYQSIKIQDLDGGEFIYLYIKDKALWVVNPKSGDIISLTSSGGGKKSATGLTLKVKRSGQKFITVTHGAIITITPDESSVTEIESEAEEPMTAADQKIDNYILDRLYIFQRTNKLCLEMEQQLNILYPRDKMCELATAVHIELSRNNIAPRPTDQQLERKKVHKEEAKKKEKPKRLPSEATDKKRADHADLMPISSTPNDAWKSFKHPTSGVILGEDSVEKFAIFWAPWVLRQDRSTFNEAGQQLYDNVVAGIKAHGLSMIDVYEAYLVHYAQGYEKSNDKKRAAAVKKFEDGLVETQEVVKLPPTKEEAMSIIINFKKLWTALVEDEDE